jgi:hypothetical protein
MGGKDTSHDIFIDIGAERLIDLLRYSRTAEARVAPF